MLLDRPLRSEAATRVVLAVVRLWSAGLRRGEPELALRRLLVLDAELLRRVDLLAIDLDGGVHAKHRIIGYHDYFLDRVTPGERVLDVGCGKGELAHDLSTRGGAVVTGIDVNRTSLAFARERYTDESVEFVEADVLEWVPDHRYDVVVMSNVLEHIDDRVGLLRRLRDVAAADRFLIRVPVLERDWVVGLRRDLGLFYFSDPTHFVEYDRELLERELDRAGLETAETTQRWGELWVTAKPRVR